MGSTRAFLARFTVLSLLLGACVWWIQLPLSTALSPLLMAETQWLAGPFRINQLSVAREANEPVFRVQVSLARDLTVNGRTYPPDPRGAAFSSTLVGHLTVPTVLLIASVLAVPATGLGAYLRRSIALLPALPLLWALVLPFILLAGVWRVVFQIAGVDQFSLRVAWSDFLLAGGQNVLAMGMGLAVAYLTDRLMRRKASSAADHIGSGTSTAAFPKVPSVAVSSQDANRASATTMPPPTVPNS